MELVRLRERSYEFILPEMEQEFERAVFENYLGDVECFNAPFVIDNLAALETFEFTEVFEENLLRDYIQRHGNRKTLGDYKRALTTEIHLEAMRLFITDVVSFLMNHHLTFVIKEYQRQEVTERWIKVPQTEVW